MAKITFVYPDFESLGVEYLMATCLKDGHEVNFVYYQAEDIAFAKKTKNIPFQKIAKSISNTQPHIVAFSCVTDNYQYQLGLAKAVKKIMPDKITIFGGIHSTAVPERVLRNPEVDCIAIGEAEKSLSNFLNECNFNSSLTLPNNPIRGIVFKNENKLVGEFEEGELVDLNTLPFPYKDPFYSTLKTSSHAYWIMSGRGCPYKCSYCFNSFFHKLRGGSIIRRRNIDSLISELIWAKERYSPKYILFLDDSFMTNNKKWISEFGSEYRKQINLPFSCISIPEYIDREKAEILSRARCIDIQIGVQSTAGKEICNTILHRKSNNQKTAEVINILKNVGIMVQADHMLGIPDDTLKTQEESILFYNKNRPNRIGVFWLTYYPKTPIVEIAKQKGILTENDIENINDGRRLTKETSYSGGSMKDPKSYYGIAFLFNYLPLLPKWLVRFLVKSNLYTIFSFNNFFISVILPRTIQSIFNRKDFRGRCNILRFFNKIFARERTFMFHST